MLATMGAGRDSMYVRKESQDVFGPLSFPVSHGSLQRFRCYLNATRRQV